MPRPKGSPKTGGRMPGSENKVTKMNKAIISKLLADYSESGKLNLDFFSLDAKDRISIAEKLMQYVIPKCQSVAVDFNAEEKNLTIEHRLAELSRKSDEENSSK